MKFGIAALVPVAAACAPPCPVGNGGWKKTGWVVFAALMLLPIVGRSTLANPADHRITEVQVIPTPQTINQIPDFAPDGRAGMIVKAYDNSVWFYLVTVQSKYPSSPQGAWNVVLRRNRDGRLVEGVTDNPHTGEDYITSIVFARGKIDGRQSTLLIEARRNWAGSIPNPAIVTYSVYRMENDMGAFAGDIDVFRLFATWDSTHQFCNSELALDSEFGIPIDPRGHYLSLPYGCMQ